MRLILKNNSSSAFASEPSQIESIYLPWIKKRWDAKTGQLLSVKNIVDDNDTGLSPKLASILYPNQSLSPNGRYVAYNTDNETATLFQRLDLQTGSRVVLFSQTDFISIQYAYSPDSRDILATISDCEFAVFDLETGVKRTTIFTLTTLNNDFPKANQNLPANIPYYMNPLLLSRYYYRTGEPAYSPDGKYFLVSVTRILKQSMESRAAAILFDAATLQEKFHIYINQETLRSAIFSPDGKNILLDGNVTCFFIDSMTGRMLQTMKKDPGWSYTTFSFTGKWRFSSGFGKPYQLLDAKTGKVVRTFGKAMQSISATAFSSDDSQLLTGDSDGVARLWKLAE